MCVCVALFGQIVCTKFNSTDNDRYSKCIKFCLKLFSSCAILLLLFSSAHFFLFSLSLCLSRQQILFSFCELTFSRISCIHLRFAIFAVVFRFCSFGWIGYSAEWCEHLQNIFVQHRKRTTCVCRGRERAQKRKSTNQSTTNINWNRQHEQQH